MRSPNIFTASRAELDHLKSNEAGIDGRWVPARPLAYEAIGRRWKAAWLVLTGRADALKWECGQ